MISFNKLIYLVNYVRMYNQRHVFRFLSLGFTWHARDVRTKDLARQKIRHDSINFFSNTMFVLPSLDDFRV